MLQMSKYRNRKEHGKVQRIICAGLIAADLVFEVPDFPIPGEKTRATTSRLITGGGALNAASAIAALGGDAALAGVVGDDMFAEILRARMRDRGIDTALLRAVPGATTSRSANLITPDGERTIVNHRDAALRADPPALPDPFPFDAALVDTRWPAAAARICHAARAAGKPAVIDAEAPVADAAEALAQATHVVFSAQGLADYTGDGDAPGLECAARQLGTWCAVTRGALPVLCHDGRQASEVPAFPATALNTLGAGDVWHGAFALALAQEHRETDAIRRASAAAALKVARPVHDETLPSAQDVEELLNRDRQRAVR